MSVKEIQLNSLPLQQPSLWRNKNYVLLWLGQAISQFGDKLYLLALPWLVLEMTQSVISATTILALELITEILFAPFVGIMIDQMNRKKIMLMSDILRGFLMVSIPVLYATNSLEIGYIYFVAVMLSLLTLVFESSSQAYLPSIINHEQLMDGNAKLTMIATIMRIVGPAIAGILIAFLGSSWTIGLNGLTFFISATFLLFLTNTQINPPKKQEKKYKETLQSLKQDIKEGFDYLIKHPVLWPITVFSAVMNISIMGVSGLFIFESKVTQGVSAESTSMIFWISGIFAFLASISVKYINKYLTKGQLVRFGALTVGLGLGLVAIFPSIWAMITCFTLLLVIGLFVNVSMTTLRQEIVPDHLLGRVMTTTRVLNQSLAPLAVIGGGFLAHQYSVQLVFVIATIVVFLNVLYAWFGKMNRIK